MVTIPTALLQGGCPWSVATRTGVRLVHVELVQHVLALRAPPEVVRIHAQRITDRARVQRMGAGRARLTAEDQCRLVCPDRLAFEVDATVAINAGQERVGDARARKRLGDSQGQPVQLGLARCSPPPAVPEVRHGASLPGEEGLRKEGDVSHRPQAVDNSWSHPDPSRTRTCPGYGGDDLSIIPPVSHVSRGSGSDPSSKRMSFPMLPQDTEVLERSEVSPDYMFRNCGTIEPIGNI